ncbi:MULTISPECIES: glycosyltransferase [Staphylococcus]|uniref:glycosyltransferase n=1 Tax=Staphylococcus TaxID=1279 RepID=UPI0002464303|nr:MULTISPECIES: glycosyltransferase [Staphylococcus]QAV30969.1 glycosyl transferase family 1 [Sulfitobacter donghicola]AGZ25844.1 putative glycosyltransferase, group 1 family protein [Staphylococcus pasteuri SP1]KAB7644525.1 glycosyltransferase [Staphylococcus sp. B2-b]MBN6854018.1 glycosyltransferase [Staphylococcus warneri]MBT2769797.1 glycosyltransferase [Staphylococcus warneri]
MIYTITSTLPPSHGGRTQALLRRIKLIDEEFNIPTKILTTNYNRNYPNIYKTFLEDHKVTKNIEFENIYEWLTNYKIYDVPKTKFFNKPKYNKIPKRISGLKSKKNTQNHDIHYYQNNQLVRYRKYFNNNSILHYEDVISPETGLKTKRSEFNSYGYLHRIIYYFENSTKKSHEMMYYPNGEMYCERHFKDNKKNSVNLVKLLKDGNVYQTFSNDKAFAQYYFEHKFKDGDIVFSDARLLDDPLLAQSHQTRNILVLHSSHLSGTQIKKSFKYAFEHKENVEKFIVLTQQQKVDIQDMYPIPDKQFAVIPHFIETNKSVDNKNVEDRFVFIGRFSKEKQLDHLLKAYIEFLKSGHQTKLALYGRDEDNQKAMMQDIIDANHLNNQVSIHKYTSSPLAEFKKSKASLLTSSYEGFGLTIMESISMGCPVISYDVRYGPNEIIDHAKNGYLVEANNINQLANYMTQIIEQPLTNVENNEKLYYSSAVKHYKQLLEALKAI